MSNPALILQIRILVSLLSLGISTSEASNESDLAYFTVGVKRIAVPRGDGVEPCGIGERESNHLLTHCHHMQLLERSKFQKMSSLLEISESKIAELTMKMHEQQKLISKLEGDILKDPERSYIGRPLKIVSSILPGNSGKMKKCCLDAFRRRTSRHEQKLENLLDRTVSRLDPLRRQGQTRCAQAEDVVAQRLRSGQRDRALVHAERVIRERNRLDGFAMVESYCQVLKERASLIYKLKECPQELREPAAGLAYAALRCGNLPELRKIRRILRSRFGREFTTAAAELRNNCGVNGELAHKFSTRQPSLEIRVSVMRDIAIEKGIEVDLAETPAQYAATPNLQRRTQQARAALGRLCIACGLREPLGAENPEIMAQNVGSAAQAASESAAAARTDVD